MRLTPLFPRVLTVLTSLWLAACGGDAPAPSTDDLAEFRAPECSSPEELCLAAPAQGFQIQSVGAEIGPGVDTEYCEVVELPGTRDDAYFVRAFESQMTAGSHHLIVAAIEPDTDTDRNAEVGARVPCTGPDVFGGELVAVTGSQLPYASESFPEGVGRVYYGGQKIVFDYHYFNTSTSPIAARAAVNFHTTEPANIERISRTFGLYNLGIQIPPGMEQRFTRECTFSHDLYVHKLTRHTHQWGTDFNVWRAGGERDGELVFSSPDYETVDFPMREPMLIRAGEGLRFECAFLNTESYTLKFGLKASDEMCILFGNWYPANDDESVPDQSCFVL